MWYEFFKYALFGPGVRALWHPRVVGKETVSYTHLTLPTICSV